MERKKLRVDGIPSDIPAGRAKDKLTIHFLRTRNGGGEVEDIEIFSGPPLYAIITFEDDKVVDSVLKIKDHILRIKEKTYKLGVSKVPGKLELDEVFKKSSLSVNCKILPEKLTNFLKGLGETYKEVTFDFDEKSGICEISGSYTKIQTLSQRIMKKLEFGHGSLKEDSSNTHSQDKTNQPTLRKHPDTPVVSQVGYHTSSRLYASAEQVSFFPRSETTEQLQEPFVWDSDIFKYIMHFHSVQYKEVLNKYNVQAVEESSDEITTIMLQTSHGDKDCVTNLRDARINLMGLYQGLERTLRKEQIDKRDWNGERDIHRRLLKDLKSLLPMLLCYEDDQHLFLIGNSGDVTLGKQHITDVQLINNPTSFLKMYDTPSTGGQLSTVVGQRDFMSHSSKHDSYENKGGSRIAAMFNSPTGNSPYLNSHQDEKYLTSSSSYSKQHIDSQRSAGSDKTLETIDRATSAYLTTPGDYNFSQVNEQSGSKHLAQFKKVDVLPALKTDRVDIRHSKSTSKSAGKFQPIRIIKASSELPYSSLVDVVPQSFAFKPVEGKLRRSNSFSNVYAKKPSDHQDGESQFKEEIFMEDWLWYYMKEFHRSEIDTWCTEITLTEDNLQGSTVLKLQAFSKMQLLSAKKHILLLHKDTRDTFTKSCFLYSSLGVQGPDDKAFEEWCTILLNCSNKLCIKLEKDALLLIYPKVIRKRVLDEYVNFFENKSKYPETLSLANDGHPSLVTMIKEKENEPDYSGQNEAENYVKYLDRNYLKRPEDFAFEFNESGFNRPTENQNTSLLGGKNKNLTEDKDTFSNFFPALQNENIQKPHQLQETQDSLKSDISYKGPDRLKSKSSELENYQTDVYDSCLALNVDSSSNLSELRRPAVGQESDPVDRVCDHCKRDGKTSTLACGHYVCDNCYSAFLDSCCLCPDRIEHGNGSALNAKMTRTSMSLRLQGYERDTTIKINYEVPDGVQRAEDPHPGKPYRGGTFSAYLPENKEGLKLIALLEKAMNKNLTFKIMPTEDGDVVTWYSIPHKTSPDGGKPKKGYPDMQYIKDTIALLKTRGIE